MASRPCLPVSKRRKARDDETISFEDIGSMDATEYLSKVVQQSSRLPEILVSPESTPHPTHQSPTKEEKEKFVPIEGSAASLSYLISNRSSILPPPSPDHVPQNGREWVDQTLANFSQLRMYLEKLHLQSTNGGKQKIERKQAVPAMKDRTGWNIFCLGNQDPRGNKGLEAEGDEEEVEKEESNTADDDKRTTTTTKENTSNACLWRKDLPEKGYSPTTSLILQLDQVMIRRVISHLSHYVEEGWPLSEQRCQWLYSLLARLEKPVHRNDLAVLFGLLKALTKARTAEKTDRKGLSRLNLLITIIGIYYEQGGGYDGVMAVESKN